jgi:hypothetical protein
MPVYALAVLLACALDELWQFIGACFVWVFVFMLQAKIEVVSRLSPLRALALNCYPITAPMPWAPVLASLVLTGLLLWASVVAVQRKQY